MKDRKRGKDMKSVKNKLTERKAVDRLIKLEIVFKESTGANHEVE